MSESNSKEKWLSIPDWSAEDRPREKFTDKGASALSDAELIAILLRTGTATESAVDLSKRILNQCNNQLNELADISIEQLTEIKGIGPAKAVTLQAAFELGRRIRTEKVAKKSRIRTANDAFEVIQSRIAHLKHEEFWVIYLSQSSKLLHIGQIGKGGLTNTVVDVRIIFEKALAHNATAIIVCHNHPSGSIRPSKEDITLTLQIEQAAKIFNIRLLDHIVVHKERFYSFQEEGRL